MTNREIEATWTYHNSTKHSFNSVRTNPHFLDWANQPRLFKVYPTAVVIPLPDPADLKQSGRAAMSILTSPDIVTAQDAPVRLEDLTSILYYSAGITRRRSYPGGTLLFRAAACTGALYSVELYVVCGRIEHLEAGIYLFNPADFVLQQIRAGDWRGALVHAMAAEPSVTHAPATIVCTGTYWRNAWKYQARTYRHFGWDNGTILANLLAITAARNLPAEVVNGFVDREVNQLLGLDAEREVALNLVPVGRAATAVEPTTAEVDPINLETLPYSHHEVDYPSMWEMHSASSLANPQEVAAWRESSVWSETPAPAQNLIPLSSYSGTEMPQDSIEDAIARRGSSRRFARKPISFRQLSTILLAATQGVPADFLQPPGSQLNDLYIISHAVEGLEPGAYFVRRNPWGLELLRRGNFRAEAGYLGLEQALPADCSAAVFFLADLKPILERFGNRGYRAIQLEAGIIGGRLYLAAYALRLGATGLTFYDDEVTRFFSPHAEGKSAIFLVAIGKPARKSWL